MSRCLNGTLRLQQQRSRERSMACLNILRMISGSKEVKFVVRTWLGVIPRELDLIPRRLGTTRLTTLTVDWALPTAFTRFRRKALGHYTQVVWKNSTRLGCSDGRATVDNLESDYWVCQYCSAENYRGQFAEKVLRWFVAVAVFIAIAITIFIKARGCSRCLPLIARIIALASGVLFRSHLCPRLQFFHRRRQRPLAQPTALIPPTFSLQSTAMCSGLPVGGQSMATHAWVQKLH